MEKQDGTPHRPQQELTQPAEGCQTGPRPADLVLEEVVEGRALPGQRQVVPPHDPMDSAMGGHLQTQGCASKTMSVVEEQSQIFRKDLIEILRAGKSEQEIDQCMSLLRPVLKFSLSEHESHEIKKTLEQLRLQFKTRLSSCQRKYDRFLAKNQDWVNQPFAIDSKYRAGHKTAGRPVKEFQTLKQKTQLNQACLLATQLETQPINKVIKAVQLNALRQHETELNKVLKALQESPHRLASSVGRRNIASAYSADEALALIIDQGFTVETYNSLRQGALKRGHNLYPSYHKIKTAKNEAKPNMLPTVTDLTATIPLQHLLDHTTNRIILLQAESLTTYSNIVNLPIIECKMVYSWGFDGSTGQSIYKQKLAATDQDDHSLFATTVIPLQLITSTGDILWKNPTPQSVRYCRPLRLKFQKETADVIKEEKASVEMEIKELQPINVKHGNTEIVVKYELHLTIIDGKVLSIITGTKSYMSCPICDALPSEFNKLTLKEFTPKPGALKYGISPLHAWIRCLEFCLHLGYRNIDGLKCWQIRGLKKKQLYEANKRNIQSFLMERLGLRVDFPNQGGAGTSNDGNTARRAFNENNRRIFCDTIGIEVWLVEKLHVILAVLSCELQIDAEKFGEYCSVVASRYVNEYGWFTMPATVHKILMHGKQIIQASAVPIGMLSEQAGESRNKLYRQFREFHARKTNRIDNLKDVFNRSLESSDPLISDFSLFERQKKQKKMALPSEALALLKQFDTEGLSELATDEEVFEEEELENEWEKEVDGLVLSCEELQ